MIQNPTPSFAPKYNFFNYADDEVTKSFEKNILKEMNKAFQLKFLQGIGYKHTKFLQGSGLEYLENSAVLARVRLQAVTKKGRFRVIFLVQMYYKYS